MLQQYGKGGETETKADKEREPLKVVSVLSFSCLIGVFLLRTLQLTLFATEGDSYVLIKYYIDFLFMPDICHCPCVCLSVCRKFFNRTLATSFNRLPRPLVSCTPAFTAGVRLIYLPFLFPLLRFIFKHYS